MRKNIFGVAGKVLLAALLVAGVSTAASAQNTLQQIKKRGYIRIALANEIPYGYMDSSGKAKGFGPDVARKVLAKMGIKDIQWTVTGFGSLIPALRAGRVDMVAASQAVLPQRCQVVAFSEPNTTYGQGLLVPKGNPKNIHSYKDFLKNHSLKMGIVSGADQTDIAHEVGIPDSQITFISSNTDAVGALQSNRIDAYAATQLTVARLAKKSGAVEQAEPFQDPIIKGKPQRDWGAFTFRKNEKAFLKEFNKNLAEVHKTAWWQKTLKGYGLDQHSINEVSKKTTKELCAGK